MAGETAGPWVSEAGHGKVAGETLPAWDTQGTGPAGCPAGFCSETRSFRTPPPEQAGGTGSLLQAHTCFQAIPWKATPGFPRQDGPLGSQAVLTRDTEWATGAQGRPGGQGSTGRFPDWGTLRARSWLRQARPDRQPPSHLGQRAARGARGTEPVMSTSPSHPTSPAGGPLPSAQRGGRIHPDLQNWELRG